MFISLYKGVHGKDIESTLKVHPEERTMAGFTVKTNLIYIVCTLQLLSCFERQIFDFLGYMWLPILGNFLATISVIFCIFGINQRKIGYVVAYLVWSVVWIIWNVFIICYYLQVSARPFTALQPHPLRVQISRDH